MRTLDAPRASVAFVAVLVGLLALCATVLMLAWPSPAAAAPVPDSGLRPVFIEPTSEPMPASLLKGFAR